MSRVTISTPRLLTATMLGSKRLSVRCLPARSAHVYRSQKYRDEHALYRARSGRLPLLRNHAATGSIAGEILLHKSVCSFLIFNLGIRPPHGVAAARLLRRAGRAAIGRYLLHAGPTAANPQHRRAAAGRDGRTDGRRPTDA